MKDYVTQKQAASKGIVTKQMEDVLKCESISKEDLLERVANGSIAIPGNKNHKSIIGAGVGAGLTTKVNVNLGVSADKCSFESEIQKAEFAIKYKADAVMDLSVSGDTQGFRTRLVEKLPIMIGTVPIYDTLTRTQKEVKDITLDDWFETVEIHAKDGIDFVTIHAGLNQKCIDSLKTNQRLAGIVSRGGSILA
ncbi:MAG: phosphomethylpyrimidine synthase ThiC, partial [Desulfobacteraceae bacterium]|nr:phosphomethylpyrimidine synthase ThiC [Desulfobacteraceae bacterium]